MLSKNDFLFKQILVIYPLDGDKISISNDNVLVKNDDKVKYQVSCYNIFTIYILGDISITTGIIKKVDKYGFTIVLASASFKIYDIIGKRDLGNVLLKKEQYAYNSLDIGKSITINKIENQIRVLKNIRRKSEECKSTINHLHELVDRIYIMEDDFYNLLGYEGSASRLYFISLFKEYNWIGRKPRLKLDILNSLLDIGYTILFNYIESILSIYGFDLYVGILHKQFYLRKSLVCDIVEPFRVIIDCQIKKSLNYRQFKEEDFTIVDGRYQLKFNKSKEYTKIFFGGLINYKEDIFLYIQRYYRYFMNKKSAKNMPYFIWEVRL